MNHNLHIITIGTARQLLVPESREYARVKRYASYTASLTSIVLTRREHDFANAIHDGNLHVYPTNSRNRFCMLIDAFWLGLRTIREEKKKGQCVVSSQDPLEVGWLVWLISRVTMVPLHVQVHGDYWSSGAWCGRSPLRYLRRFLALMLLRRAPAVRVVSERIKQSLVKRGVREHKITVLPIRPELETFLKEVHVFNDTNSITFLSLGRLAPEKDIPRIVRAFALVNKQHPHTRLRIVGEGSECTKIESLITKLKLGEVVTLTTWTDNVPYEMSHADIFLLASLHEAYALTLVEAMAVGIPVVTTDVGCVGDVVRDGEHGLVVHEEGDEVYAQAMERMVTDIEFRKKCGEQAHHTALELSKTTQDAYAEAWVTAISKAL